MSPFDRLVAISAVDWFFTKFITETCFKCWYIESALVVSQVLAIPTFTVTGLPPILAKTTININGKAKLNTTAEGLRIIDRKLANAMARVARVLLYFVIGSFVVGSLFCGL